MSDLFPSLLRSIPSVVSASPALTEFCGMLLNRALIPSNLVSGSRTTAGATW